MSNKNVRLGIIGCGVMGTLHLDTLSGIPGVTLAAAADHVAARREAVAAKYHVPVFEEGDDLIASGKVDAVIIATPHYAHATLAIAAMERGLHVLCEKPLSVTAASAQEAIDCAASHPELVFAVMFQMRLTPIWRKVKAMLDAGAIGELMRMSWTITTWFRSQAYYDSGDWRATWAGEGGGLLINQCPHNLDLLCWLFGQPTAVVAAQVGIGRHHQIEVEDEVAALLSFANGAWGTFVSSTAEAPGVNRMEIVGDRGTLIVDPRGEIQFTENSVPSTEFLRTTPTTMAIPDNCHHRIEVASGSLGPEGITKNFIAAIREGEPLVAPAAEGVLGLELGNAILMCGLEGGPIQLPMDRAAFDRLIQRKIAESTATKAADAVACPSS